MGRYICNECDHHLTSADQILRGPNPFDPDDVVLGCPACKSVNELARACYFEDCWQKVSCGTPTKDGYKWSCSKHKPEAEYGTNTNR
jgi:hypothetical protein